MSYLFFFNRNIGEISNFFNAGIDYIHSTWKHLLDWDERVSSLEKLEEFSTDIYNKTKALKHCIGFIDGTLKATCKPSKNDKVAYSGHKRRYGLKYQCVVTPDGMIVHLNGPWNGSMHDSAMLANSELYELLQKKLTFAENFFCLYGDLGYAMQVHIQCPNQKEH